MSEENEVDESVKTHGRVEIKTLHINKKLHEGFWHKLGCTLKHCKSETYRFRPWDDETEYYTQIWECGYEKQIITTVKSNWSK